jgi:hypothetical protein
MTNLALVDLYVVASVSQVVLMLFAVYYAIRIMHRIGTLWAWTLMVVAFAFLAVRDFASVASLLSTPLAQLAAKTDTFIITSYWPGTIINEVSYATLAVATYGLSGVFKAKTADVEPPLGAPPKGGFKAVGLESGSRQASGTARGSFRRQESTGSMD